MARDAWYFLVPLIVLAGVAFAFGLWWPGLVLLLLAGFVAFFFRDPERDVPLGVESAVSPADGRVIAIEPTEQGHRLSIFLSVFNVHVNRAPIAGEITREEYKKGKFLLAFDARASVENEQLIFTIRGERELTFALIAGILARRIVPWKKLGDKVSKGDRIALIRFGSRVDMMLPSDCEIVVRKGEKVYAGRSIVARWREKA
jgi:phosphatidylserine decarboxylase